MINKNKKKQIGIFNNLKLNKDEEAYQNGHLSISPKFSNKMFMF